MKETSYYIFKTFFTSNIRKAIISLERRNNDSEVFMNNIRHHIINTNKTCFQLLIDVFLIFVFIVLLKTLSWLNECFSFLTQSIKSIFYSSNLESQQGNTKSIDEKLDNELLQTGLVELLAVWSLNTRSGHLHLHPCCCQYCPDFGLKHSTSQFSGYLIFI